MNTFKKISAFTLIIGIAIVTFIACNKEKEQANIQQPTETEAARKPIATFDNTTGQMTYHLDVYKFQQKINVSENARTGHDRYVVESILVLDNDPSDSDVLPEIKITILDTEEECSYTTWFMDYFTDKRVSPTSTSYYLDEEVANMNFTCYTTDGTNYQITCVNGEFTITEDPTLPLPENAFRPKWFFTCRSTNCGVWECEKEQLGSNHWTCSPCGNGGTCERVTIIDMLVDIFSR